MTDERMDRRLREYAARWSPGPVPEFVPPRRTAWVPFAAAAAVVVVVAGVAVAVRREPAPPPPAATASPTGPAPVAAGRCGEDDTTSAFAVRGDGEHATGTLQLTARNAPCLLPHNPRFRVVGAELRDIGVVTTFADADRESVVPVGDALTFALEWDGPRCAPAQPRYVLFVDLAPEVAFRVPLTEYLPVPDCAAAAPEPTAGRLTVHRVTPVKRRCGPAAYAIRRTAFSTEGGSVGFTAFLTNVSDDFCEVDLKPSPVLTHEGRRLGLDVVTTSDLRVGPPLPPGGVVRAEVLWSSWCAARPAAYDLALDLGTGLLAVPLHEHPVPRCRPELTVSPGSHGQASAEWLARVDPPR